MYSHKLQQFVQRFLSERSWSSNARADHERHSLILHAWHRNACRRAKKGDTREQFCRRRNVNASFAILNYNWHYIYEITYVFKPRDRAISFSPSARESRYVEID